MGRGICTAAGGIAMLAAFAPQDTGHVQVECPPGVRIFLDGEFKGVTNAEDGGLILQDVPAGRHRIKAVREGFQSQEDDIEVERGKVLKYTVKQFVPKVRIKESGREGEGGIEVKTGKLVIQSLPIECAVTCDGLGLTGQRKTKDRMEVSPVPVGRYEMVFEGKGKVLRHAVTVEEEVTVTLFVNFVKETVEETRSGGPPREVKLERMTIWLDGEKKVGMEFVAIPPGRFRMGSENGDPDEKPVHEVEITKGFWMGVTEVTQEQWEAVMGSNPSMFKGPKRPVEMVSWEDCKAFFEALNGKCKGQLAGKRAGFPTEAEWEYACRAGSEGAWCFGDDEGKLGEYAWYKANSGGETHDVGQKRANAWGLYDMYGNVWEWCEDWYGAYAQGAATDPEGPSAGQFRVLRGGSWRFDGSECRSPNRGANVATFRDDRNGVRAVLR